MDGLRQDLRFALRTLAQVLLRLLPVKAPERLYAAPRRVELDQLGRVPGAEGVGRQHQPLHHPLPGAREGGDQPGPPGVVIEPPLEDAEGSFDP
jgi:hypothetical protein